LIKKDKKYIYKENILLYYLKINNIIKINQKKYKFL